MKKPTPKFLQCIIYVLVAMCLLSACSGKTDSGSAKTTNGATITEDGCYVLDILENIDMSTVKQDGACVYFDVFVSPEQTIPFGGVNVAVENDCIVSYADGFLFSMEHMGAQVTIDIQTNDPDCWYQFGHVYADSSRVTSLNQLYAAFPGSVLAADAPLDLSECRGGFFSLALAPSGDDPVRVDTLVLTYDPSIAQTLYHEITDQSELDILADFLVNWDIFLPDNTALPDSTTLLDSTTEVTNPDFLVEAKMAEPGSIESDIIAGIDLGSVTTEGDTTRFTSVMANGETIRFAATNISISKEGLTLFPGATVTSLDAVGKIYYYTALVDDVTRYTDATWFNSGYGYTYSASKTSVEQPEQVHTYPVCSSSAHELNPDLKHPYVALEPNFVYFSADFGNEQDILLTSLYIGYNPEVKVTGVAGAKLDPDFTTAYLANDLYNFSLEAEASDPEGSLNFYLLLQPDTEYADLDNAGRRISFVPGRFFSLGDLRDASGQTLDKQTAHVYQGTTLDLTVGDYTLPLSLEVLDRYAGAATLKDLLPYATLRATGEVQALVVPVAWADQPETANDEALSLYQSLLGRVLDTAGNVTDHSGSYPGEPSLSEYFDTASYGTFQITSFLTDWYHAEEAYADMETTAPDKALADNIILWVKQTYPDMDWSQYDRDGDGYIDALILLNAGVSSGDGSYVMVSYGGAVECRSSYFADYAGTQEDPTVNTFVSINQSFLANGNTSTLIHEFSHLMGLIDYYDTGYSGIDAVGGFDMQSNGVGDWNAYSKLAVGWMTPQVVTGLASGESIELTIGSSALTSDVIVIPAAGTEYDGPFGEYMMIDLFSDDGVNQYDAAAYGLSGIAGIRISHVDATMEMRTVEAPAGAGNDETVSYTIGTVHHSNAYNADGMYLIEVIQSGGVNTLTDPEQESSVVTAADLFYTGDVFRQSDYSDFFCSGLMDSGLPFGYTITVVSIGTDGSGNPTATIRITAE